MNIFKNIFVVIGIAGIFALHPSLNKEGSPTSYLQYLVYGNSLSVNCSSPIDKSEIQIKWICENKTAACSDLIIFKNGRQVNKIPFEQGNQKLIVFYKENKIGEVYQFKNSSKQAHQYKIDVLSKNNSLYFNGEIIGPAAYKSPARTIASL